MKKYIFALLVSGFALSANVVFAAGGSGLPAGASSAMINAAGNHQNAVQTAAGTIAAHPRAQARMDAAMASNPQANSLMTQIQQAGGYTPGSTTNAMGGQSTRNAMGGRSTRNAVGGRSTRNAAGGRSSDDD